MATAARAAIVVGDVFDDEAAGELQLRYMSCLDGAPLDKAARTHEKLRTLGELLSPFLTPESKDCVSPIGIDVSPSTLMYICFNCSDSFALTTYASICCASTRSWICTSARLCFLEELDKLGI